MKSLIQIKAELSPSEFANTLIQQGPIFRHHHEGFWIVTRLKTAEKVLKSPDFSADRSRFFMSRMAHVQPETIADFLGVVQKMMVTSDAPQHTARRRLASLGISDHVLEGFQPHVVSAVNSIVSQAEQKMKATGRVEFVKDISEKLPSTLLADLFCIPESERSEFYRCSNTMTQFFGGASQCDQAEAIRANESASQLRDYFQELIRHRKKSPLEDFLSILLKNQDALDLDDSEVISQAIMMLVAGEVTTTDQMSNNLHLLLTSSLGPAELSPDQLDTAIEEATRLDPSVNFVFRVAKRDCVLDSQLVQEGELVFVSNHAVNRDPEIFENPEKIKLDRVRNPHLSYGHGPHYCLGARLARIQMQALFLKLWQTFPHLRIDGDYPPQRKVASLAFSGFDYLSLRN